MRRARCSNCNLLTCYIYLITNLPIWLGFSEINFAHLNEHFLPFIVKYLPPLDLNSDRETSKYYLAVPDAHEGGMNTNGKIKTEFG